MKAAARHLAAILYTLCIGALIFYAMHGVNHLYFGGC